MTYSALIVEDNHTLAEAFTLTIDDQFDYETVTINDGQVALDYLQRNNPQLILLDLHLPSVDGIEILNFLERKPYASSSTILVLTADILLGEKLQDQFNIVSDILYKPFTLADLARRIRQLTSDRIQI